MKHPYEHRSPVDHRFSATIRKFRGETLATKTCSLQEKSWCRLKDWVVELHRGTGVSRPMSGEALRKALFHSDSAEYRHVKEIIARKNWPEILNELSRWAQANEHLL